jgi:hypothetical protein
VNVLASNWGELVIKKADLCKTSARTYIHVHTYVHVRRIEVGFRFAVADLRSDAGGELDTYVVWKIKDKELILGLSFGRKYFLTNCYPSKMDKWHQKL